MQGFAQGNVVNRTPSGNVNHQVGHGVAFKAAPLRLKVVFLIVLACYERLFFALFGRIRDSKSIFVNKIE